MLDTQKMESLRKKLGLTQEQAAQRAGLPGKQVWNDIVQNRRRNITMDTLDALAKALACHPKELIK
ncbi:MAG: helix-turn-helix domain-containing protein [Phycisphaerales bacterium]